jgi:glycosyltransferase involved in cell wall biosynthesis
VARVLITGFCAIPGAHRVGVQLRHVVRAIRAHHHLELLVAREGEQAYVERMGGVRTLRVPVPEPTGGVRAQGEAFQRALQRQLDGAEYDIVHCRDGWAAQVVRGQRDRAGFAMIYDLTRAPLGDDPQPIGDAAPPDVDVGDELAREEQLAIAAADLVLAPSEAGARYARGLGARAVALSPAGVDVDRFDWDEPARVGAPVVLSVGPIAAGRGLEVLVRAADEVAASRAGGLVLRLIGPIVPAVADALRALPRAGSRLSLELLGVLPHHQLPAQLAHAAVCVAPVAADAATHPAAGASTTVLEYLACRRPVVVQRAGHLHDDLARLLGDGAHGRLLHAGDVAALAAALADTLDDPAAAAARADAGYQHVRAHHTASGARRAVRHAYAELCQQFAGRFAVRGGLAGLARAEAASGGLVGLAPAGGFDGFDDDDEHTVFDAMPAHSGSAGELSTGWSAESGSVSAVAASVSASSGARGLHARSIGRGLVAGELGGDDSGERAPAPRKRSDTNLTGA